MYTVFSGKSVIHLSIRLDELSQSLLFIWHLVPITFERKINAKYITVDSDLAHRDDSIGTWIIDFIENNVYIIPALIKYLS